MQSVSCESMRAQENQAFSVGHSAEELMLQAGERIAQSILHYYPSLRHVTAYLGKGHNAGDAIVVLNKLQSAGWDVQLRLSHPEEALSPLTRRMLHTLSDVSWSSHSAPVAGSLLLDALLGIGANGPLRSPLVELALEMNHARDSSDCITIALDSPSGVNADSGEVYAHAVKADHTLSIGYPKSGILQSSCLQHVGAITQVTLDALPYSASLDSPSVPHLITPHTLERKRRNFDTHKGQAGRVGIWAGSTGMLGAAVLCATAALRSGAGLITLCTPGELYPLIAAMLPAEVMVHPTDSPLTMLEMPFDTLIIGPGIGTPTATTSKQLLKLAQTTTVPTVLDADMLNLIAREGKLSTLPSHCILTPHPGEMKRLYPATDHREKCAKDFCDLYPVTLLLKGARTIVTQADSPLFINSSGTPAMATAGQGDVLSGLIGGLCAQGYSAIEACKLSAWLAGEAAQIAIASQDETEETLTASSVISHLPRAFASIPRRA